MTCIRSRAEYAHDLGMYRAKNRHDASCVRLVHSSLMSDHHSVNRTELPCKAALELQQTILYVLGAAAKTSLPCCSASASWRRLCTPRTVCNGGLVVNGSVQSSFPVRELSKVL